MSIAIPAKMTTQRDMDCEAHSPETPDFPVRLRDLDELGSMRQSATNLAMKLAYSVPSFSTDWMTQKLHLPLSLVGKILWDLKDDKWLEVLGQDAPLRYRFSITGQGREHARRLFEVCGYVGPVPVQLQDYTAWIERQHSNREAISIDHVLKATDQLILPPAVKEIAALAVSSGRSLFIFGPAGNGKSTLGRLLHRVIRGSCWIPHAIGIDDQVIRVFDPQVHKAVDLSEKDKDESDGRWIKIHRPLITAGGEMTMDQLDMSFNSANRYYEAPSHLKANCGTFFIDDFGRQRVDPHELLNRWIIPLEHNTDYVTLNSGQKIEVPFCMMLIVATNLKVNDVADEAFLRRMGYRLQLGPPHETNFRLIIQACADNYDLPVTSEQIDHIVDMYRSHNRPWRASEPQELFARCLDLCRLRNIESQINTEIIDVAWRGYFSEEQTGMHLG